jgi:hypothetical protein
VLARAGIWQGAWVLQLPGFPGACAHGRWCGHAQSQSQWR